MANPKPKIENLKNKGKGRPKGAKNKFTNLKSAFLQTFEEIGGVEGLAIWAKKNKKYFIKSSRKCYREKWILGGN